MIDSEERLEELYKDVQLVLEAFGNLIVLRQQSNLTTLSASEIKDEAKQYVERNAHTIWALLRT